MRYLFDANTIINKLEDNLLEVTFEEFRQHRDEIWVTLDVQRELNGKLDDENKIKFENIMKKGTKEGYVIDSRHKFRIKEPFKTMAQDLRKLHVRLQRTDRNLIALSCQVKAKIISTDTGIEKALEIIKTTNNPYRNFALAVDEAEGIDDFTENNPKQNR